MKVSIIIPHFNQFNKLIRLIDSIPDDPFYEIIVIDDNSTNMNDDQFKYLYGCERIKFIKSDKNMGAGFCRNIGIAISTGDFLLFADSDDYFITKNLLDLRNIDIKSETDIVFFPPVGESESENEKTKRGKKINNYVMKYIKKPSFKKEVFLRYRTHVPWSKLYRKSLILDNNIKFDEIKVSNDVMFSLKTGYFANSIKAINTQIYVSVKTRNSLTSLTDKDLVNLRIEIYLEYLKFIKNNLTKKEHKRFKLSGLKYLYRYYINNKSIKSIPKAIEKLKRSKIGIIYL